MANNDAVFTASSEEEVLALAKADHVFLSKVEVKALLELKAQAESNAEPDAAEGDKWHQKTYSATCDTGFSSPAVRCAGEFITPGKLPEKTCPHFAYSNKVKNFICTCSA